MRRPRTIFDSRDRWIVSGAVTVTVALLAGILGLLFHVYQEFGTVMALQLSMAHLDGAIRHLDEVLTMSARLSAATGDLSWEQRYLAHVDPLDVAIKEAAALVAPAAAEEFTALTGVANQKLVAMELRSFELVRSHQKEQALRLLTNAEYTEQKEIYAAGITTLLRALEEEGQAWEHRQRVRGVVITGAIVCVGLLMILGWVRVLRALNLYRAARTTAEHERQVSEERFRDLAERTEDGIWFYQCEPPQILYVNPAIERIWGLPAAEFYRRPEAWLEAVHPEDRARVRAVRESCQRSKGATPYTTDFRVLRPDGSIRWVHDRGVICLDERGNSERMSGIAEDITERKRVEEERVQLATLVENSYDAIGMATLDGKGTFVNPAGRKLFGVNDPGDWIQRPIEDFFPPGEREKLHLIIMPALMATGAWVGELVMRNLKTGGDLAAELTGFVVTHPQTHEPMCLAMVTRDIRERKRAEEEITALNARLRLRASELEVALAESEEFAYAAAHNLRAPLRGIDGFCQAVLEDDGERLSPEGGRYLSRAREAAQRLADLIDELLQLSRLSHQSMLCRVTDLSALARAIADGLRQREPQRPVEFVIADGLAAECDGALVRRVLEELLENAWKFTAACSPARIEFGAAPEPDGTPAYFVRDNGVGFDMAYAGKLFVPFQRLHGPEEFPGTGMGLTTVQRIIRRHGGRVWAEGTVGRGATFYFTL